MDQRDDVTDESTYDRVRLGRRTFLRLATLATASVPLWTTTPAAAEGPIVKPLPADTFILHGTNAETRWEALAGVGNLVPIDRFFVRNHTLTPALSAQTWRLKLFGTGLRGAPTATAPVELTYQDLLDLPADTVTARIECAGNGRSFFTSQQNQTVSGTPWQLGAVGVARWRGVRLATILERAGLRRAAVDVLPRGLDPDYVTGGVNLGPVRRPLPVSKALKDVLVAYEMNGEPLGRQNTKSAFELPPGATVIAGRTHHLRARATDRSGAVQPAVAPFNTQGYLFGAVVRHPVTVLPR
jgi:DMSO/TMAO reductase YedYZ molybdopterin-dependent catalytic subunit